MNTDVFQVILLLHLCLQIINPDHIAMPFILVHYKKNGAAFLAPEVRECTPALVRI